MVYKYDIDQVLRENFDISDKATRKYLASLDEDDKSAVATALASALYDKIIKRVDDIDFGTIPKSMGDITKVDGYQNTVECLDIIKKLVLEYKESPEVVDTVINAVENVKAKKALFMKGFATKTNLITTTYNLIVLAIEHSVSFLISVCIEYIKNSDTKTIDMALDKTAYNNAHDNLLFEQLISFNSSCGSGELDSCFTELFTAKTVKEDGEVYISSEDPRTAPQIIDRSDDNSGLFSGEFDYNEPTNIEPIIPENDDSKVTSEDVDESGEKDNGEIDYDFSEDETKPAFETPVVTNEFAFTTAAVLGGAAAIVLGGKYILRGAVYLIKVLIPKLRHLSYFFIHTRVKISDSLAIQAQMIELNAYRLKSDDDSDIDENKRQKIAAKQLKTAEKLKKWSNKFAIDNKTAEKKTRDSENNEDNTAKTNDNGDIIF